MVLLSPYLLCSALLYLTQAQAWTFPEPTLELLSPRGIRISIPDDGGIRLFAVHFSINQKLTGTRGARYNYDVTSKTGSRWVFTKTNIKINKDDVINYWLYVIRKDGRGYQITDRIWSFKNTITVHTTTSSKPKGTTRATPTAKKSVTTRKPYVTPIGCPAALSELTAWNPGNNLGNRVVIASGQALRLDSSATVHSIEIQNRGKLVFNDIPGQEIKLRTRQIKIQNGGELHIGSESCKYKGKALISLYGRDNEGSNDNVFGKKFIGVMPGGLLELHGEDKVSWTYLTNTVQAGAQNPIINLAVDVSSWHETDRVVLTSTDHDMEQAEEFNIIRCAECSNRQVKLQGSVKNIHWGEVTDGVDMRGEVGMLTHNIRIEGEMEKNCYNYQAFDLCRFFKYDTFGGHIMILKGFKAVHIEGVEVTKMGQQTLGRYPIHFHLCDDITGTYVKGTSIHHVFNRCITIHRTNSVLIQDTVGYETLGHCYFLEDGGERFNILDGNLGAVTRYGTVLPTDRNSDMCKNILHNVWPGFIPDINNCNSLATFWMAHPDNILRNNAAAGSEGTGIWYVMHGKLSGPSARILPDGHSSRAAIGEFTNNRVHGHPRMGIMIDFGIKDSYPSASRPQERFAMGGGLYMPHVNSDTNKPRDPAILDGLIAYKCKAGGWMRGGDIFVRNSAFADNHLGLTLASAGSLPYDYGSHQEVTNSVFIGESNNRGTRSPGNRWYGTGYDGKPRTFGDPAQYGIIGYQIYDGPIKVENCSFKKFIASARGKSSAIGFFTYNPFMMTPATVMSNNKLETSSRAIQISTSSGDGDITSILHDVDGTLGGYRDTYLVRRDNYLVRHPGCIDRPDENLVICGGNKAINFYVVSNTPRIEAIMVNDEFSDKPMTLKGLHHGPEQQHQFSVWTEKTYTIHWNQRAPTHVWLNAIYADEGDWVRVGVCYPARSTFTVYYDIKWVSGSRRDLRRVHDLASVDSSNGNDVYYWDQSTNLLFVKVRASSRNNWDHCSSKGCERVNIEANMPSGAVSNCRSAAYGRYRKNPASVILTKGTCNGCGAQEPIKG